MCVLGFFIEDLIACTVHLIVFNGQIYFFDGANVAKYLAQFAGRDVARYIIDEDQTVELARGTRIVSLL